MAKREVCKCRVRAYNYPYCLFCGGRNKKFDPALFKAENGSPVSQARKYCKMGHKGLKADARKDPEIYKIMPFCEMCGKTITITKTKSGRLAVKVE